MCVSVFNHVIAEGVYVLVILVNVTNLWLTTELFSCCKCCGFKTYYREENVLHVLTDFFDIYVVDGS